MKWRTVSLAVVFAMALGGLGTLGWAQMPRESEMMGPGHGMGGFPQSSADRPLITFMLERKQDLGLSADQVHSLEAIRQNFQQAALQRIKEIEAGEAELEGLLKQSPVDLNGVEATLRKIEGLKTALRLERIKVIDEGKSLLTSEQRNRLETLLAQDGPRPWRRRG